MTAQCYSAMRFSSPATARMKVSSRPS
jgi:hypothetical protein